MPFNVRDVIMPALNSFVGVAAGMGIRVGGGGFPVVTQFTEHGALARPGEFLIASFQPLTAQPTSISSSTAEPPGRICCTNEKYGSSRPVGFVARSAEHTAELQ